jgi:hypothetical protein
VRGEGVAQGMHGGAWVCAVLIHRGQTSGIRGPDTPE